MKIKTVEKRPRESNGTYVTVLITDPPITSDELDWVRRVDRHSPPFTLNHLQGTITHCGDTPLPDSFMEKLRQTLSALPPGETLEDRSFGISG